MNPVQATGRRMNTKTLGDRLIRRHSNGVLCPCRRKRILLPLRTRTAVDPAAVIDVLLQKSPVVETHHSTNDATQQELGPTGHESHDTHSASYGNECLVCLETFKPESNVAILPCRAGHSFHYNCIQGTLASLSCRRAVGRGDGVCVFVLAPVVWYALRIHFFACVADWIKGDHVSCPTCRDDISWIAAGHGTFVAMEEVCARDCSCHLSELKLSKQLKKSSSRCR